MSPTPEPRTGIYLDSSGTRYLATNEKRNGWWLQKQVPPGDWPAKPFQRPDFAASVNARIFIPFPETP